MEFYWKIIKSKNFSLPNHMGSHIPPTHLSYGVSQSPLLKFLTFSLGLFIVGGTVYVMSHSPKLIKCHFCKRNLRDFRVLLLTLIKNLIFLMKREIQRFSSIKCWNIKKAKQKHLLKPSNVTVIIIIQSKLKALFII